MADRFYTHRLTKMLEDFVLGAGMTVHISDEASTVKLKDQKISIEAIAASINVECVIKSADGVTQVRFQRRG